MKNEKNKISSKLLIFRPTFPCRNICEQIESNCVDEAVASFWPNILKCEILPSNEELCLNVKALY